MKWLIVIIVIFCTVRAFCQDNEKLFGKYLKHADSVVALTEEYKGVRDAAKDLNDSFAVTRYYASQQDRRSRGIAGGVIKYELGYYSNSSKRVYHNDYFLYYSLKQRKVVLINDGSRESVSPEMELLYKHTDSVVENSRLYTSLKNADSNSGNDFLLGRSTTLQSDSDSVTILSDTIVYRVMTYPHGIPCAGSWEYTIYYSVKEDKVLAMKKEED